MKRAAKDVLYSEIGRHNQPTLEVGPGDMLPKFHTNLSYVPTTNNAQEPIVFFQPVVALTATAPYHRNSLLCYQTTKGVTGSS
jgi:hypothetical protein